MEQLVKHKEISQYADSKVNLKAEHVKGYRDQVNRLRENLEDYINAHPDYNLLRMYHAGSVAKGTALRTLNDMDVAVYIKKTDENNNESNLLAWLQDQLREAYKNKNIKPEQIQISGHCVTISFVGTGLDVDVSPVLCNDTSSDFGYLIKKNTGERVLTNIPLHLKFIRDRKKKQKHDYRQVIRLTKWWIRTIKSNNEDFRFKSFLAELICAHLLDSGLSFKDYTIALENIFAFIVKNGLKERIFFTDNYSKDKLPSKTGSVMEVFDPINPDNNIVGAYTEADRLRIVEAAHNALDSINEAKYATTKAQTLDCWRRILGPSFNF